MTDKTLLDFGCAEGYFMFRFMQDGGLFALGVETNDERRRFINSLADAKNLNVLAQDKFIPAYNHASRFDIGIYLDLWGDGQELPPLKTFHDCVETLFVSPCRNGEEYNPKLESALNDLFRSVKQIHKGYENRAIFRCDK